MLVILIHCNRSLKKHESSIIMEQSLNSIIFKKEKEKKKKARVCPYLLIIGLDVHHVGLSYLCGKRKRERESGGWGRGTKL